MKTEDLNDYENKRLGNNPRISNEPLTPDEQQDAIKAYTQYLEDEVERYKSYWQECSERNEQLTAALKAMLYAHGQDVEPMTTEESCYYCGVQMQDDGDALDYEHAPDCAWERARGMVGG